MGAPSGSNLGFGEGLSRGRHRDRDRDRDRNEHGNRNGNVHGRRTRIGQARLGQNTGRLSKRKGQPRRNKGGAKARKPRKPCGLAGMVLRRRLRRTADITKQDGERVDAIGGICILDSFSCDSHESVRAIPAHRFVPPLARRSHRRWAARAAARGQLAPRHLFMGEVQKTIIIVIISSIMCVVVVISMFIIIITISIKYDYYHYHYHYHYYQQQQQSQKQQYVVVVVVVVAVVVEVVVVVVVVVVVRSIVIIIIFISSSSSSRISIVPPSID